MTQPDYVPLQASDRIRAADRLTIPGEWRQDRPAELVDLKAPTGPRFGATGTDLGYGLKLAHRFEDRLQLAEGETLHDAIAGGFACGTRRSAFFGRGPVIYDLEWAYSLWGLLGGAPDDLIAARVRLFRGASHDYSHSRQVADAVRPATLRMTPAEVRAALGSWGALLNLP